MPSTLIGNPLASGAQIIVSGKPYSGWMNIPIGGIQLRLDNSAGGNIYVGFSGNITANSGGMFLSGGGTSDGMVMYPGDAYFIPKSSLPISGVINIYARHDATASGIARLYYQIF